MLGIVDLNIYRYLSEYGTEEVSEPNLVSCQPVKVTSHIRELGDALWRPFFKSADGLAGGAKP